MVNFTFHNVSINTEKEVVNQVIKMQSLHSTMFLLIQYDRRNEAQAQGPLHSTMFLLIQLLYTIKQICRDDFTFHNVSINTGLRVAVKAL